MTLSRQIVSHENLGKLMELNVRADQPKLVAPNSVTVAQSAYMKGTYVWGLFSDDAPVGMMAMIHPHEFEYLEKGDDADGAYLWRLMIDKDHQGNGFGVAAIYEALAQTVTWKLPSLYLSVAADQKNNALAFYQANGFIKTGRIVEGETELKRTV